ncbi:hypothetical protein RKD54_001966 [Pseudarthrobacter sp. SLBN-100]|nr:hypothetical protein [Arthrobacter sp. SLBN-100]
MAANSPPAGIAAASHGLFRYRDEDDFHTFLDGQAVGVEESIGFRPKD